MTAEATQREKKERRWEAVAGWMEMSGDGVDDVSKLGPAQPIMMERMESWRIQAYLLGREIQHGNVGAHRLGGMEICTWCTRGTHACPRLR